jgi:GDP-4-dehydro-6-deoxy-D-mannose reductase
MKRLLVTGLSGFVGQHVKQALMGGAHYTLVEPKEELQLTDRESVERAIDECEPERVLHLAGQSFVPASVKNPRATYDVNFFGTLNLLEALKRTGFSGRMVYVGSADAYGLVSEADLPIVESHPLRPRSPYGVSKAAAELLCYQWTQNPGFRIVMTRPFNHVGPKQAEHFVVPDFARQLAEIKLGRREPVMKVGDIDVTRDFTDVRDVATAYLALLEDGEEGEVYNVCSGNEHSIRDILNELISLTGVDCRITGDQHRMRMAEARRMRGSFEKLEKRTGWRPRISLRQSLSDVAVYWENRLVSL